jgi:hypothetical protein
MWCRIGQIFVRLLDLRSYRVVTAPFYENVHATDVGTPTGLPEKGGGQ